MSQAKAEQHNRLSLKRQIHPRSAVAIDVKVYYRDLSTSGIVLNISASGAKIRSEAIVTPGEKITLLLNNEELRAEVVWATDAHFGICFELVDEQRIEKLKNFLIDYHENSVEREYPRRSVFYSGEIQDLYETMDCRVRSLSAQGATLTVATVLDLEKDVRLTIGRFGSFDAEIVWQKDGTIGVIFKHTPEVIAAAFGDLLSNELFR